MLYGNDYIRGFRCGVIVTFGTILGLGTFVALLIYL